VVRAKVPVSNIPFAQKLCSPSREWLLTFIRVGEGGEEEERYSTSVTLLPIQVGSLKASPYTAINWLRDCL